MPSIPHISFPPRLEGGRIATVEQDSPEEIRQNVLALLNTTVGSRIDSPEYGIPDETFSRQSVRPSADVYLRVIEEFEPRARVLGEAEVDEMVKRVTLRLEG